MTINAGWLDWAVRRPGPPNKHYSQQNQQTGLVVHSAEGWLPGIFGELDNPSRQASWHLTNALDGAMYQSYAFSVSCWASGNFEANTRYIAVESEGIAGTPLNDRQVVNMLRLAGDLPFALVRQETLWEHNEVATKWTPNAGPTSCPSHRYDGFFAALEDSMTPAELARLARLEALVAGNGLDPLLDGHLLTGEDALKFAAAQGYSAFLGIGLARKSIADHEANHPGGGGSTGGHVVGTFEGTVTP